MPEGLLTVEQFAEYAKIGRTNAYALVCSGQVESIKIGRLRRIPSDAVGRYVERMLAATSQGAA